MADLQDDLTPLQLGTAGMFNAEKFELIGRLRVAYADGYWNEWHALFGGGKTGWLAEAQGFYAICFPFFDVQIPARESLRPGKSVDLGKQGTFQVEDMRAVDCIYSEGELPIAAHQGRKSTSVDLSGDQLEMATIEYASDVVRLYVGKYQEFDEFKFQNLRHIDGW